MKHLKKINSLNKKVHKDLTKDLLPGGVPTLWLRTRALAPLGSRGMVFGCGKWLGVDMVGWAGIKEFVLFLRRNRERHFGAGSRLTHLSDLWAFFGQFAHLWILLSRRNGHR